MIDDFIHRRMRTPYTLHVERLQSPRRHKSTVVLIHGIGSSTLMWNEVAKQLPSDARVIAVDLLGFGKSPKPAWATYDAPTQARSLIKTLLLQRVPLGSLFVGHSLGSLVAVELARRIPRYPSQLILVSAPIYKPSRGKVVATQQDDLLRGLYKILQRYPKNTERGLQLAKRYYVKRTGATVAKGVNIASYLASLESSIINQNTIDHITDLRMPILFISGARDPLVVKGNLKRIALHRSTIQHTVVKRGGHNVVGDMVQPVVTAIQAAIHKEKN